MKYVNKRIKRRQIFSFKEPSKQAIWLDANDFKKKIYINGQWVEVGGDVSDSQLIEYINEYFANAIVQQVIDLDRGWNWVVALVGDPNVYISNQILNTDIDQLITIKTETETTMYQNSLWQGSLEHIEAGHAYQIECRDHGMQLIITGHMVNPLNYITNRNNDYDMVVDENGWAAFTKSYEMDLNKVQFNIELNGGTRLYGHNPASPDDPDDALTLATYHDGEWDNNITIQPGRMYQVHQIQVQPIQPRI